MISEFPLFVFTMFSGASAGAYLATTLFRDSERPKKRPWILPLACLVLLGIGLLASLVHLGQPARFLNALAHGSAPIALEAYCSMIFGTLVLADLLLVAIKNKQVMPLQAIASVAGLALTLVTGYAYFECYGVPAWASLATLPFFSLGDIALGLALALALSPSLLEKRAYVYTALGANIVCLVDLVAMGAHFAACGEGWVEVGMSALMGPVACSILTLCGQKKAMRDRICGYAVAALMVASVALVRYSFYAMPTL